MPALLHSPPIITVIGVLLYAATTLLLMRPQKVLSLMTPPAESTIAPLEANTTKALWNYRNPEVEMLIEELRKEKQNLTIKEQQLAELDARLKAERAELNQLTQSVYQLQRDITQSITQIQEEEAPNLKKLAKIYSTMGPSSAAGILSKMTDDQVIKVLAVMKDEDKARLLEAMASLGPGEPKRVADLIERLRLTSTKTTAPAAKTK